MATQYFAANTLAGFFRSNATTVLDGDTTAGTFDSAYVASAIKIPTGENIQSWPFSATGTVWIHFEYFHNGVMGGCTPLVIYNGAAPAYRLLGSGGGSTVYMEYWNGSAWVTMGTTFSFSAGTRRQIDIKLILGTSMAVYVGGTLVATNTGMSGPSTITTLYIGGVNGSVNAWASQIMVADFDTRDSRLMQCRLNGDSATNTGGTGAYTTVDEAQLDESTAVTITTSGNKQGQTHAAITVPAGYVIKAAYTNARARATGAITDGKLGFRSGGTNYSSAGLAYAAAYEPRGVLTPNDPATAIPWTQSGFNNAEVYEEAV